jgi:hypothetical protein
MFRQAENGWFKPSVSLYTIRPRRENSFLMVLDGIKAGEQAANVLECQPE